MLTDLEVRSIPLFTSLSASEAERIAGMAADIRLVAGEFAVPEGGERALYAVLAGKIEVVKLVDGVERTLGWRLPGTIFGEVPLTLGTPFPGGYRAAEPSRVLRLDAQQYYSIIAATPDVAVRLSALARERIGGLQGIAAEVPKPRVTIYGERSESTASSLRRFLERNEITFEWLSPSSPELARSWPGPLPAPEECPHLRLADGTLLCRPTIREVAVALGLATRPAHAEYDTAIIGGGPAGLAAAVYGASEGLRTIVIEREAPGGQAGTSSRIENYLGFPSGVSGDELASRALRQARRLGAEILVTRSVTNFDPAARELVLDGDELVRARTVILATGVAWRRVGIEGLERLLGKGVAYGAARSEAPATHGRDVYLIGGGNSAGQAALYFANHARHVTLVVRGERLEKSMSHYLVEQIRHKPNLSVLLESEVTAVHGNGHLTAIEVANRATGETRREGCDALFVFIGAETDTTWLPPAIARDERGYVLTGHDLVKAGRWSHHRDPYLLESSVPGVFACGDVRLSPVKRVASAVGEGSMAIAFVHQFLQREASS